MTEAGAPKPDPAAIRRIPKPPFVRLPEPARLFAARAARLRQLGEWADLAPYLRFVAVDRRAPVPPRGRAAAPGGPAGGGPRARRPSRHAAARAGGLRRRRRARARRWARSSPAQPRLDLPAPARAALERVAAGDRDARAGMVANVLGDAIPADAIAEHALVAAALQVHFAALASQLDAGGAEASRRRRLPRLRRAAGDQPRRRLARARRARATAPARSARRSGTTCGRSARSAARPSRSRSARSTAAPATSRPRSAASADGYVKVLYQHKDPAPRPGRRRRRDARARHAGARARLSGAARSIRSWPGTDPVGETRDLRRLPSVDVVLRDPAVAAAAAVHGRASVLAAVRASLAAARASLRDGTGGGARDAVAADVVARLDAAARPKVRPVFNLTGTVLHTNLGRALLAEEAVEAAVTAMRHALALEFDLDGGKRGERDAILRDLLVELTGAEDATVVNNNAAAVLLALNTLAAGPRGDRLARRADRDRRRLPDARHHGASRHPHRRGRHHQPHPRPGLPRRARPRHRADPQGPHLELPHRRLRQGGARPGARRHRPRGHGVPLVNDLGSGTLVDLAPLRACRASRPSPRPSPRAPTSSPSPATSSSAARRPASSSAARALVAAINRNPMKRAMRIDKLRLAALEATLRLYRDPDRLAARLPTLRLLARPQAGDRRPRRRAAPGRRRRGRPRLRRRGRSTARARSAPARCRLETIPSAGLALSPADRGASGQAVLDLAAALRALPVPVIGRIADGALLLDLRCLEDADGFRRNSRRAPAMSWLGRLARAIPSAEDPMARADAAARRGDYADGARRSGARSPRPATPARRTTSAPASPAASASRATRRSRSGG